MSSSVLPLCIVLLLGIRVGGEDSGGGVLCYEVGSGNVECFYDDEESEELEEITWHELPVLLVKSGIPFWLGVAVIFSVFTVGVLVSFFQATLRNKVHFDWNVIDTFFDSGGNVNSSLLSCHLVAKWLWIGSLVGLADLFRKSELKVHMWMTVYGCVPIFLSTLLACRIRIIAPGAKTFLQVIKSRFGTSNHVLFIVLSLLVNAIIASAILADAAKMAASICDGIDVRLMAAYLLVLAGFCAILSGLGGAIYLSYCACLAVSGLLGVHLWGLYARNEIFTTVGDEGVAVVVAGGDGRAQDAAHLHDSSLSVDGSTSVIVFAFLKLMGEEILLLFFVSLMCSALYLVSSCVMG